MIVFVKYLILVLGFYAAFVAIEKNNVAAGIVTAGAFIGYALIEIQDLKILNKEDKNDNGSTGN
jgi:uncharacterized membrane protein YjfL (UPF0719 family)